MQSRLNFRPFAGLAGALAARQAARYAGAQPAAFPADALARRAAYFARLAGGAA